MMAGYEKKKVVNRLENLSKAENDIQQRLQKEENSSILEYDMVVVSDQNQIFGLHSKPNNIKALGKGEYSSVLQSAQKAQQEVFSALGNWLHDEFYDQHSSIGNREKGALFFSRNYEQRMHQEFDEHENLHRIEIHDLERYDGDEYEGAYIYKEHPRARFFVNDKDNLYLQSWSDRNHAYTFNNGELTVTSLNGKDDYESLKFKDGIISEKIALLNGQRIKYQ